MTDLLTENTQLRAALADLVAGGNRQLAIISRRVKHTDPMTLIVTKGQMLAAMNALATPAPDAVQEAARVPEIAALIEAADNLMLNYLQDELEEPDLCVDEEHWAAIHDFNASLRAIAGDRT